MLEESWYQYYTSIIFIVLKYKATLTTILIQVQSVCKKRLGFIGLKSKYIL